MCAVPICTYTTKAAEPWPPITCSAASEQIMKQPILSSLFVAGAAQAALPHDRLSNADTVRFHRICKSLMNRLRPPSSVPLLIVAISFLIYAQQKPAGPQYNKSGALIFPSDYREWSYLTSG